MSKSMARPIRTQEEKRKYGPLWNACDAAYHWAYDRIPTGIRNKLSEQKIAFSLGALSGYGVAELGAHVAYPIADNIAESLGTDMLPLKILASTGLLCTAVIPLAARIIAPDKFDEWMDLHPRYSSGVFGVMAGASIGALQELFM